MKAGHARIRIALELYNLVARGSLGHGTALRPRHRATVSGTGKAVLRSHYSTYDRIYNMFHFVFQMILQELLVKILARCHVDVVDVRQVRYRRNIRPILRVLHHEKLLVWRVLCLDL